MTKAMPRYPIYVPSKGRAARFLTAKMFLRDAVPFHVVVEPQEHDAYAAVVGTASVLTLPESGRGLVYSRNWIKDHSRERGEVRHWQFDDDVKRIVRLHHGRRLSCAANAALAAAEDFVERYENVPLASLNSWFFLPVSGGSAAQKWPPFYRNARCYTCFLMLNAIPNRWRGRYNEDTDMTLQVLASGWCTILFNAFLIDTPETMTHQGGQTDVYVADGRLRMARELERRWPGVVEVYRRFGRPQHRIKFNWRKFDTPLRLRPDAKIPDAPNEYGLQLRALRDVASEGLRRCVTDSRKDGGT